MTKITPEYDSEVENAKAEAEHQAFLKLIRNTQDDIITTKLIATYCIKAQVRHEESYGAGEYGGSYAIDYHEAAELVCAKHPQLVYLVYLLNTCCWNDIQSWALDLLEWKWEEGKLLTKEGNDAFAS